MQFTKKKNGHKWGPMDYTKQVTTEIDRMVTMNHLKANF